MTASVGIEVRAPVTGRAAEVLTPEALALVARLERELGPTRQGLLRRRAERQAEFDAGSRPDFLTATRAVREGDWTVAPAPADLRQRWVEITGPTDRKMVINALNSGADVYMADFEDANTPTWTNLWEGQVNLSDAIERRIDFTSPEGKAYRLNERVATLLVRPRSTGGLAASRRRPGPGGGPAPSGGGAGRPGGTRPPRPPARSRSGHR